MGGEDSTDYEKVYGCCRARGMNDGYLTLGEDTHRFHGWEHKKTQLFGSGSFRPIRSKGGWEHSITESTNVSGYQDCYVWEAIDMYNFALAKQAPDLEHCAHPYGFSTERNMVVTFQELDAAGREKMALRKPELSERYAEVEDAIVA